MRAPDGNIIGRVVGIWLAYYDGAVDWDRVIACHHAILDGGSLATLMAELAEHYLVRLGRGEAAPSPPEMGTAVE